MYSCFNYLGFLFIVQKLWQTSCVAIQIEKNMCAKGVHRSKWLFYFRLNIRNFVVVQYKEFREILRISSAFCLWNISEFWIFAYMYLMVIPKFPLGVKNIIEICWKLCTVWTKKPELDQDVSKSQGPELHLDLPGQENSYLVWRAGLVRSYLLDKKPFPPNS